MPLFNRKPVQSVTTQTPQTFSRDIWDYLGDMPYMPSRQDRDELLRAADKDPKQIKRASIWGYFFRINPADLGKPQLRAIEELTRDRDVQIAKIRARRKGQSVFMLIIGVLGAIVAVLGFVQKMKQVEYGGVGALVVVGLVVILIWVLNGRKISKIVQEFQQECTTLTKQVELLKRKMPTPPTADEMNKWLEEDIQMLRKRAIEKTGLAERAPKVVEGAPNPVCIAGPAFLQKAKAIPEVFLDQFKPDLEKHFAARSIDLLDNEASVDFYGVYSMQFFIVADTVIGSYGCFFDFITGKIYKERTTEMYYKDVVTLSTRREYRRVDYPWIQFTWENSPTFALSLASGEVISVTYPSSEYLSQMFVQTPTGAKPFDAARWVRDPDKIAEQAQKALRAQLSKFKV